MSYLFKLGFMVAIVGSISFNTLAFGDSSGPSSSGGIPSVAANTAVEKPAYIIASLDERNSRLCHIVEETPLCQGMAPQKSQTADHGVKTSLSSSQIKPAEASRTFFQEK
jgi:hypothetical protein